MDRQLGQVDTTILVLHIHLHMVDHPLKVPTVAVLGVAAREEARLTVAVDNEGPISKLRTGIGMVQLGADADIHPMMQAGADRPRVERRNPAQRTPG